jgi:serine/threonine-protein kinase
MTDFAKVLDFGLAKVTEAQMRPGSMILTQEGMVFGTPEFMSPEQARGNSLDARSDIYSLACILYEAITGKLPFEAKTPMEYVSKHVTAVPIRLSERVEGRTFPKELDDILAKALSKNPNERQQSALELADALEPFSGLTAPTPPVDTATSPKVEALGVVPAEEPSLRAASSGQAPTNSAAGPSSKALVMVALAFMILGGVGAVILMNVLGK